jgi:hypothetical protein
VTDVRAAVARVLEEWGCAPVESDSVAGAVLGVIERSSDPGPAEPEPPVAGGDVRTRLVDALRGQGIILPSGDWLRLDDKNLGLIADRLSGVFRAAEAK